MKRNMDVVVTIRSFLAQFLKAVPGSRQITAATICLLVNGLLLACLFGAPAARATDSPTKWKPTATRAVKAATRTLAPAPTETRPASTRTTAPAATATLAAAAQPCSAQLPTRADPAQMARWFDCVIRSGSRADLLDNAVKADVYYAPGNTGCEGEGECWPKFSAGDTVDAILMAVKEGQPGCMGYSTAGGVTVVYQGLVFDHTAFAEKFLGAYYKFSFQENTANQAKYSLGAVIAVQASIGISKEEIPYGCAQNAPPAGQSTQATTISPTPFPCTGTLPTRLRANGQAFVSLDPPLPNRLRKSPGYGSSITGQIDPGTVVSLLEEPQCVDNTVWWRVRVVKTGQEAWTAEGDSQGYWLVPCASGSPCPSK